MRLEDELKTPPHASPLSTDDVQTRNSLLDQLRE